MRFHQTGMYFVPKIENFVNFHLKCLMNFKWHLSFKETKTDLRMSAVYAGGHSLNGDTLWQNTARLGLKD